MLQTYLFFPEDQQLQSGGLLVVRTRLVVGARARVRVGHDRDMSVAVIRQATEAQLRCQTLFVLIHDDDARPPVVQYIL